MIVSEQNFPLLHAEFNRLQSDAGISGYRLAILGDGFGGAGVDYDRKLIGIGIRKMNSQVFEEILAAGAHELGHVFRHNHPAAPLIGEAIYGLSSDRMREVEADRFGALLMGETASTIEGLRHGGVSTDPELSIEMRIFAVEQLHLPAVPASNSRLRQRD